MAKRTRKPKQLEIEIPTWGGKRRGAGRKRAAPRRRVAHRRRPVHVGRHPVHVTLRVKPEWRHLRKKKLLKSLHDVLRATNARGLVRICEFCFIDDHVHLIVEAADARALSGGMQGFALRLTRALQGALQRRGGAIEDRYHTHTLTSPLEVRRAVAYVINNARKHRYRIAPGQYDLHSSGPFTTALASPAGPRPLAGTAPPIAAPTTWLLGTGWRKHHPLIDVDEVPSAAA